MANYVDIFSCVSHIFRNVHFESPICKLEHLSLYTLTHTHIPISSFLDTRAISHTWIAGISPILSCVWYFHFLWFLKVLNFDISNWLISLLLLINFDFILRKVSPNSRSWKFDLCFFFSSIILVFTIKSSFYVCM